MYCFEVPSNYLLYVMLYTKYFQLNTPETISINDACDLIKKMFRTLAQIYVRFLNNGVHVFIIYFIYIMFSQ